MDKILKEFFKSYARNTINYKERVEKLESQEVRESRGRESRGRESF